MIDLDEMAPVLGCTDSLYMAVCTSSGPHVTPELFTVIGGFIVCMTSAVTVKARRAQADDRVSLCAWTDEVALAVVGSVEVVDPTAPLAALLSSPATAALAPFGAARFLRENAGEMVGATVQGLLGQLGRPLPPRRVLLAVTPISAMITTRDGVRWADGWDLDPSYSLGSTHSSELAPPLDLTDVPGDLGEMAVAGLAALGWCRADGAPLALPVTWDPDGSVATLSSEAFEMCGAAPEGPACVTFDTWTGYGPLGKQGVMLRGTGAADTNGPTVRVRMDVERASYWDGIETGTVDLPQAADRAPQIRVDQRPDGRWVVKKVGAARASRVYDDKSDAERRARAQAEREGAQVVIDGIGPQEVDLLPPTAR